MATVTATDFLVATGTPGLWVRLRNNVSGTDYYSTAVSDPQGSFTYTAPAGEYSLYTGTAATVPGTPNLRSAHYQVAVRNGDDAALGSATLLGSGSYTPKARTGFVEGEIGSWGPMYWDVMSPLNPGGAAKFDTRWVADGAISNGLKILTSNTAAFTSADVGKTVMLPTAGAASGGYRSTIASVQSGTSCTTADAAGNTVSASNLMIGTDDTVPWRAAIYTQMTKGGTILAPPGASLIVGDPGFSQGLIASPGTGAIYETYVDATTPLIIQGAGRQVTSLVGGNDGYLNNGLIGYNTTVKQGQVMCFDLTLDGNYAFFGGAIPYSTTPNVGALVDLPFPYQKAGAETLTASAGIYHHFERVRFYRSPGYGWQGMHGAYLLNCEFESMGQQDQATHFDILGTGEGDAYVLGCHYKDSTGNFFDMVNGVSGHIGRIIFLFNTSKNHIGGGVYAAGNGSQISFNTLQNNSDIASGIGYDVGTLNANRANNIVIGNSLVNLRVAGGLSNISFGDVIWGNAPGSANNVPNEIAGILALRAIAAGNSFLDLSNSAGALGALAAGTNNAGDKISLWDGGAGSTWGLGLRTAGPNELVVFIPGPSTNRFAVRQSANTGNASDGTLVGYLDANGHLAWTGHLISSASGTPVTTNLGANVTSVTFTGNDTRGTIAIVMSAGLAANTRVCTATFATTYGATGPKITLVDQTSTAGLAVVNSYVLAQSTGVSFDLAFDQALVAGTYTIDYIVIG